MVTVWAEPLVSTINLGEEARPVQVAGDMTGRSATGDRAADVQVISSQRPVIEPSWWM